MVHMPEYGPLEGIIAGKKECGITSPRVWQRRIWALSDEFGPEESFFVEERPLWKSNFSRKLFLIFWRHLTEIG